VNWRGKEKGRKKLERKKTTTNIKYSVYPATEGT